MEDINLDAINKMQEARNAQFSKWIRSLVLELKRRDFSVELELLEGSSPVFAMALSALLKLRRDGYPDWTTYVSQHLMDIIPDVKRTVEGNILGRWAFHMSRVLNRPVDIPQAVGEEAESSPIAEYWPEVSERYGVTAYRVANNAKDIRLGKVWSDDTGTYVLQQGRRAFFGFWFWQKVA